MTRLLAIDPGNVMSGYVLLDTAESIQAKEFGKTTNDAVLSILRDCWIEKCVIEKVESYGMTVGVDVFDTVFWSGRFAQVANDQRIPWERIGRKPVKKHLCGSHQAKDKNVVQALVDRFAPGERNFGKGTKDKPGWFYGFNSDVWQAYALAVYAADVERGNV